MWRARRAAIEPARRRRIAPPFGKSDHLEKAHAAIEPDRQHVAGLHGMAGRRFACAIDADMAGLHQRSRTGAGFDHPGVPQPFVETLALQATPLRDDRMGLELVSDPCGWR